MKDYLIFAILIYLTKNKKTTAKEIASEFEVSSRSIYRYIDALSLLGVPVVTKLGNGGGIELLGDYYLERFMLSKNEKQLLFEFSNREDVPNNIKSVIKKII